MSEMEERVSFCVKLSNVGIIREADLSFIPGLNLLVGPSSSGKSTLLRCLESFVNNTFHDSMVTSGESVMSISIDYGGNFSYVRDLSTRDNKSVYTVNGEEFAKVGRVPLPALLESLVLGPVSFPTSLSVNFSPQFSAPFLLFSTPSVAYEVLSYRSSFDVTRFMDLYKRDMSEAKKTQSSVQSQLSNLEEMVESESFLCELFRPSLDHFSFFSKCESLHGEVSALKSLLSEYELLGTAFDDSVEFVSVDYSGFDLLRRSVAEFSVLDCAVEFPSGFTSPDYDSYRLLHDFTAEFLSLVFDGVFISGFTDVDYSSFGDLLELVRGFVSIPSFEMGEVSVPLFDEGSASYISGLVPLLRDYFSIDFSSLLSDSDSAEKVVYELSEELSSFKVCPLCNSRLEV